MAPTIFLLPTRQQMPTLSRLTVRERTRDANNFSAPADVMSHYRIFIIIGFSVAGALVLAIALWRVIRYLRRRAQAKKANRRSAPSNFVWGDVEKTEHPADGNRKPSIQ
jgi:hypothetical protein